MVSIDLSKSPDDLDPARVEKYLTDLQLPDATVHVSESEITVSHVTENIASGSGWDDHCGPGP